MHTKLGIRDRPLADGQRHLLLLCASMGSVILTCLLGSSKDPAGAACRGLWMGRAMSELITSVTLSIAGLQHRALPFPPLTYSPYRQAQPLLPPHSCSCHLGGQAPCQCHRHGPAHSQWPGPHWDPAPAPGTHPGLVGVVLLLLDWVNTQHHPQTELNSWGGSISLPGSP